MADSKQPRHGMPMKHESYITNAALCKRAKDDGQ